jgi:hypothetical protein
MSVSSTSKAAPMRIFNIVFRKNNSMLEMRMDDGRVGSSYSVCTKSFGNLDESMLTIQLTLYNSRICDIG